MNRLVNFSAVLVCSSFVASLANAQAGVTEKVSEVERLSNEAMDKYNAGDFQNAIVLYLRAYKAEPSAAILYNVAVVYDRKLDEKSLALDYYRRFVGAPDADAALVEKALARIRVLKEAATIERAPATERARTEPAAAAVPAVGAPVVTAKNEPSTPSSTISQYILMSVGGAAFVTGAVFGVLVLNAKSQFDSSVALADKKSLSSSGKTKALTADILMGIGGAAAVGGALWMLLSPEPSSTTASLGVGPSGAAWVSVQGTW